jgi:hypothetical protein
MPAIILSTTKGWNNRNRKFGVYLDKQKIGTIQSGQTKEFEIAPGEHHLKAKTGFFRTKKTSITLVKDEKKSIKLKGSSFPIWVVSLILISAVVIVMAMPSIDFSDKLLLILLILPEVVYLFYYQTFRFKFKT